MIWKSEVADHHARRHAEQVDHRRREDEAAADAEHGGEDADEEADAERRDDRDVEARAREAPLHRQAAHPDAQARAPAGIAARAAERAYALPRHQAADHAEEDDVEDGDGRIDDAEILQQAEDADADGGAGEAAHQHQGSKPRVDLAFLPVRETPAMEVASTWLACVETATAAGTP